MKIGNAVQTVNANQLQGGKNKDNVLNGILKQISNVQEQMQKLNENDKMSLEQKTEKRNLLQEQLSELNKQLSERQMEMQKKAMEKIQRKIQTKSANNPQKTVTKEEARLSTLNSIMSAGASLSQINAMNSARVKSEGEARVLETEIKQDRSRNVDVSAKQERLDKIEGNLDGIAQSMMDKVGEINDNIANNTEEIKNAVGEQDDKKENISKPENEKNDVKAENEKSKRKSVDISI